MARRSKLTPELREKIANFIKVGNYANRAAEAAGITEQTFYNWMNRGAAAINAREALAARPDYIKRPRKAEKEHYLQARAAYREEVAALRAERPYIEFFESVTRAEAEAEARSVAIISKAANDGEWRAALEFLSRKFPERWSAKQHLDVTSKNETTIEDKRKSPSEMSDEELDAFLIGVEHGKQQES